MRIFETLFHGSWPKLSMKFMLPKLLTPLKSASKIRIASFVHPSKIFVWEGYHSRKCCFPHGAHDWNRHGNGATPVHTADALFLCGHIRAPNRRAIGKANKMAQFRTHESKTQPQPDVRMPMCLSRSHVDDNMPMCLSNSQDDSMLMFACLCASRTHILMITCRCVYRTHKMIAC